MFFYNLNSIINDRVQGIFNPLQFKTRNYILCKHKIGIIYQSEKEQLDLRSAQPLNQIHDITMILSTNTENSATIP
jgi:hypothetical protein